MEVTMAIFVLYVTIADVAGERFCGKQLADMLDLVCAGRGFHWRQIDGDLAYRVKRSTFQHVPTVTARPPETTQGGVVTECCRKACSIADLESYCARSAVYSPSNPTASPLAHLFSYEEVPEESESYRPPLTSQPVFVSTPLPSSLRPSNRFRFRVGAGARVLGFLGIGNQNKFFFVRPVGPRPTRSPVPRI